MGLDMYLEGRKFVSAFSEKEKFDDVVKMAGLSKSDLPHSNFGTISLEVMYWRKVNAVHEWFVREVQGGEDDCKSYHVSRDKLAELLETCKKVADKQDQTVAEELLPSASGFFFGSTDYDEYYYEGLLWTIEGLEKILKNPAYDGMDFYYQASW